MAVGAAAAAAAAAAVARARAEQKAAQERSTITWSEFAERNGLRFSVLKGPDAPFVRMEGVIADTTCAFEVVFDADGWAHTRAIVDAKLGVDAVVTVHPNPHGVLDGIKRALFGSEDASVGDAVFDDAFLVHAEPRAAAASLLAPDRRAALKLWLAHKVEVFSYERGRVLLLWRGIENHADVLEAAISLLAHAAAWRPPAAEIGYR